MADAEDLAHTPAERAAAAARKRPAAEAGPGPASAAGGVAGGAADGAEAGGFEVGAEELTVGASEDGPTMVVVGAGLVGSLCAAVLRRKGFRVHVFERYPDIRAIPNVGRSINLSVTSRGLRAVKALGGTLYDEIIQKFATKIKGRIIHQNGGVLFQRYGKDDSECNYSVSRVNLNKFLIAYAIKEGAEFHFDHHLCESSDFSDDGLVGSTLHFLAGSSSARGRLVVRALCPVVACDGGGSRVRYALRRAGLTSFSEELLSKGYKEVLFPDPGPDGDFGAKGQDGGEACPGRYGLHIWPRGDHFLMALSNVDGSFTGTIYMENKGPEESFEAFDDSPEGRRRCAAFCERHYAEVAPLVGGLDALVRQITRNPNGILGTVQASTWAVKGKVVLIGDACHAMVPFFGQGCNCGFEDTLWLSRLLDRHCGERGRCAPQRCTGEGFAACFAELARERKPNADAICAMALENFVEMREKTADAKFRVMKKVENRLENAFPEKFRSRYAMVCYGGEGNVSYENAQKLGAVQWLILEELCAGWGGGDEAELLAKLDMEAAERLIDERLVPRQRELHVDLSTVRH